MSAFDDFDPESDDALFIGPGSLPECAAQVVIPTGGDAVIFELTPEQIEWTIAALQAQLDAWNNSDETPPELPPTGTGLN